MALRGQVRRLPLSRREGFNRGDALVEARKPFHKRFPQIAQACERLPPNTLIDGEIVALDESGRVSFNILQHHRSKAQALLFYVIYHPLSWVLFFLINLK
jgi:ATP-dependent DNA ligase